MRIVIYIIIIGLLSLILYGIWYGNRLQEGFERDNELMDRIKYVSLDEFNEKFNAEMVALPKNILGIGISDGEFFIYNTEDINDSFFNFAKVFLSYFSNNIYYNISKNNYYFVLCFWDGYGENMPYCDKLISYNASKTEFINKYHMNLSEPCKTPILHKNRRIFAFSKRLSDYDTILIPDAYFIKDEGFLNTKFKKIDENRISYSEKVNKCVYRGTVHVGNKYNFINFHDKNGLTQREYLKKIYNDGKIENLDFEDGYMSIEKQLEYKYILDIDGTVNTWDATVWKLYSGSVLLKTNSVWKQWYYDDLKPWVHYVPIENDFSDINEKIKWCIAHDDECYQITQRAKKFIEEKLNWEKVKQDTIEIFRKYIENI